MSSPTATLFWLHYAFTGEVDLAYEPFRPWCLPSFYVAKTNLTGHYHDPASIYQCGGGVEPASITAERGRMSQDFYAVLNVLPSATRDEIKKSYYELAKANHPDKSGVPSSSFLLVQQAYEALKDPETRKKYDETYARIKTIAGVARVAAEVDLDDMEFDEVDKYHFPCRCGGSYEISEDQLAEGVDLVFCGGCTLQIRVLYEMQEEA